MSEKATRDRLNHEIALDLHIYHSRDSVKRQALTRIKRQLTWQIRANISGDHIGLLPLVPGMKVTITDNAAVSARIVNGSEGTLWDITYDTDSNGLRFGVCAYVHIPGCGLQISGLAFEVVPILPIKMAFVYAPRHVTSEASVGESRKCNIVHSQLPLLPAYAFIDYKIQGHSLDRVIIDLHSCRTLQSAYVMLSRARSLEAILIMRFFKPDMIYRTLSEQFRTEFRRLRELEALTKVRFDARDRIHIADGVTHSDQVHSLQVEN